MGRHKCAVCGGIITDDYETECPFCGSYWCFGCEMFISPDKFNLKANMCNEGSIEG